MKKSDIHPMPAYFSRYIKLVDDCPLDDAFQRSLDDIAAFDWEACRRLGVRTYANDKWNIPETIQHLLDWERIMTFRSILFVRETGLSTQSLDVDALAQSAAANPRALTNLVEELITLRQATRLFFKNMREADLLKTGVNWQDEMSVLGMGFTILGHQAHHFNLIRERYLTLPGA